MGGGGGTKVELVRNLMARAQKQHFVFRLNGRVHLNRRGSQFSRLLAAEVCASALVMLDTPRSEVVWEYWLPPPFASFPFTSPPVCHHIPNAVYNTSFFLRNCNYNYKYIYIYHRYLLHNVWIIFPRILLHYEHILFTSAWHAESLSR